MKNLKPEQALVFEPREFAGLVLLGISAGEAAEDEPLEVATPAAGSTLDLLQVPDNPYSKATFALRRHFAGDDRRFASALMRFRAFMSLLSRGALGDWVRVGDGGRTAIHPAVLDVASAHRLSGNGRFPPRKFLAAVAEVAETHYRDLPDWQGSTGAVA